MNKVWHYALVVPLTLVLTTAVPQTVTADDGKIVVGERVGDVSLNMSIDDILKMLGTPSRVERSSTSAVYDWAGRQLRVFQSLSTGETSSIRTIYVFGQINPYRTEHGLTIGATEDQVKRVHGSAVCFTQGGATWRELWWAEVGIQYIISTSSSAPQAIQYRVMEIGVRRPTTRAPASPWRPCA